MGRPAETLRLTPVSLASLACGALYSVEIDLVGQLIVGEIAVVLLAGVVLLGGGAARHADARTLWLYLAAGVLMLAGFALSDLLSVSEPWQYLRGWARVAALVAAAVSLIVVAAQSPGNLWWLCVGYAGGSLAGLIGTGVSFERWKLGYGEPLALLVVTLGALLPATVTAVMAIAFGVLSVLLDYRSLGAALILVGASMLWRRTAGARHTRRAAPKWALPVIALAAAALLAISLVVTNDQFGERRQESNVTRFAMLNVALQAIADSPIIGFGSWPADPRYERLIRSEEKRVSALLSHDVRLGESLIPHSQLLQAWLEGGVLAVVFFGLYGAQLAATLAWLLRRHACGVLTPLFFYLTYFGLWNWVGSPFLGITRLYIALAIAIIAVLAAERRVAQQPQGAQSSAPSTSRNRGGWQPRRS
jgi:hypothetical protein